ncbi:MAG: hypothetical protein LBQ69_01270 [Treponema sp.]|jgi:hypothetical protein|nr:hypothetical protein [Treponema sp.]
MKRLVIAAVFIAVFAAGSPVFAQKIPEEHSSEFYYVSVTVEKVWPYRAGYIVQYRKGPYSYGRVYLPMDWFTDAASKGEIINLPPGTSWPTLSVYYKNGEFSHVRLYVHRMRTHQTWGNVPLNVNIDSEFENIETIDIKFR